MMLAMLQPWQPTWLMGPGDGYMRRLFLRRRLKMSSDHPLRLSLYRPLEPRSQCKNIRRRQPTLDDLEYSQRLDDSVDLSHLQVPVNICKGKLEITAPLQPINPSDKATSHTVETGPESVDRKKVVHSEEEQSPQSDVQMTTSHAVKTGIETIDKKKVVQSEERQSPQSDVETTKENKSGMKDATITEKGEQDQAERNGAIRERAMEIEDIGVDEESDRISISPSGTYSVNC
ncbi:uncharacterized protein LOC111244763 [Varroa destructor]|uniref:Uncharacterized protein n=1 Tax=Varroa destructor TaxID=109461 RepID=A0A7M7JHU1_VARDE|nr:uncharacterized protein LOC111244763 [Varroa destructor]